MAIRMERGDDARLLLRRHFGENGDCFNKVRQFTVGHGFNLGAERNAIDLETDVPTYFARHDFVVARQNLDGDSQSLERCQGRSDALLGRVEKSDEAQQRQAAFLRHRIARLGAGDLFIGDRHDAKPIRVERPCFLPRLFPQLRIEFSRLAVEFAIGAGRDEFLDGALANEQVLAGRARHPSRDALEQSRGRPLRPRLAAALGSENDRKTPAREIEWNFIDASIMIVRADILAYLDMPHDGLVEQTLQAGLMPTVEISVFQGPFAAPAANIEMQAERDLVLRQRSCLVGAQHVHRAKILNCIEPLYDHALLRHGDRALGEIHRDDHREQFRRQADRDGESEQERLRPISLRQPVDQENRGREDEHEADHQPYELVYALIELREPSLTGEFLRELAEIGARAGANNRLRRRSR